MKNFKTNIKVRKTWGNINPATRIFKTKKGRIKHKKDYRMIDE